jgi:hypothetical protein
VRLEARPPDLAAENRQLVAEHEDLELLGSLAAAEEHDELEQATDDDVQGGHKQRRPPADGRRRRYSPLNSPRPSPDRVFAPHGRAGRTSFSARTLE